MGMGKGATGIRKEVVEEESSTPLPWRHATALARARGARRKKNCGMGRREDEDKIGQRKKKKDASEERMTQMLIAVG